MKYDATREHRIGAGLKADRHSNRQKTLRVATGPTETTLHACSTDRRLIASLTWQKCPFCNGHQLHICATPSSTAISCDQCGLNAYLFGDVESANRRWNRRSVECGGEAASGQASPAS